MIQMDDYIVDLKTRIGTMFEKFQEVAALLDDTNREIKRLTSYRTDISHEIEKLRSAIMSKAEEYEAITGEEYQFNTEKE
jgi:cell division septum initiation protein DivIVA